MSGRIPKFIVQETEENKNFIIIEKDGVKMILLNLLGSVIFTMEAIKDPQWYNIIIAVAFAIAAIIWVAALKYIYARLKTEKKKYEETTCNNASPNRGN
jgi:hypothetical protein